MLYELGIRPSGALYYISDVPGEDQSPTNAVADAFKHGVSTGLFSLLTDQEQSTSSPSFRYWHKIACHYLTHRCHQPSTDFCEPLALPDKTEVAGFLIEAPPMVGAEYLSAEVIIDVWQRLDRWLCEEVNQRFDGRLEKLLQAKVPHWHQVGRVCFHLAENKHDPEYPFAFMATYASHLSEDGRTRFQPLGRALTQYAGAKNKKALIKLLSPVDLASKASTQVKSWIESGDLYHPLAWTANEAYHFIKEVPIFEESGIIVRLPDWWKKRAKPRVAVTIGDNKLTSLTSDSLLDFQVHTALGDQKLTQKEWLKLLNSEDELVLFKGQWVEVDREKLAQALDHWQSVKQQVAQEGMSFAEGMRLLSGMPAQLKVTNSHELEKHWSFVDAGASLKTVLRQMRSPDSIKERSPGTALKATLRPYQSIGVNWLSQLSQLGLGACLADDMGLGKTIQVIALLLVRKKTKTQEPSLLVLPASLINNWKDEISRFSPSLKCHFVHPAFLSNEQLKNARSIQGKDLILTTYGMLSRHTWLLEQSWQLVILDEAQAIKNPATKQTKVVKKLKAQARIALTGTPVENRLGDLWSLFDFLCPGLLGNSSVFKKYLKTLDADAVDQYAPLRSLISPYILRRLKSDKRIVADLPDKTELYAYCGLSKPQAALYQKSVEQLKTVLAKETTVGSGNIKRRGLVLSYLLRFKQICNHPAQWLEDGNYKPENSGKFMRLAELAEEISTRQEKLLVFTQFRELTQPLADFLSDCFAKPGLVLHGGTTIPKRKHYVDQFQREDGPPFFVLSLKAGGTGLNLTAASHVVHFDRWWNPAVENQATDRAYRIGQKRNVLVHKFVCKGTIEEKIDAMISEKSALTEGLLSGDTSGQNLLTEMSDDELIKTVALDVKQMIV